MAGGIDWFRWHHGSVTDPKFQLVARKAGVRLPDVLAVWAFALEQASAADDRGSFGELDCEAIDCLFGLDDGKTAAILEHMGVRGLIDQGRIQSWDKRQPKREREDSTAAERQATKRARDKSQKSSADNADDNRVTPRHATSHQKTPRGEEGREEERREDSSLRSENTHSGDSTVVEPTEAGRVCLLLKRQGISSVNPSNELLRTLLASGATDGEFLGAVDGARGKKDPFKYILGTVKGIREEAAQIAAGLHKGPLPVGPPSRKERQLTTAALMTGAASAPIPPATEFVDVIETPRIAS